jgi:two-component system, OmpR family, sensor kinase
VRTTRRIAAGDLDARMPVERTYPELVQLGESINTMAEELARSRATERQFVLSISHDLRTPLTSIRGYAEAIADGAAPDPVRAATVIASEAGRLERLFQDLLDLARLDARRFTIDVRRVDLPEVAATAAEGLRIRFEEAGLPLAVETPPAELPVAADPDRLAQVVTNLLENARKFARSAARLATAPVPGEPEMVALVVEDDGPGIPAADLPHVFERFYTGSTRDRGGTGTGLGLAIVSELVQAMGGSATALSPTSPAGGTRIVVRLRRWAGGNGATPPPAPQTADGSSSGAPAARDAARRR